MTPWLEDSYNMRLLTWALVPHRSALRDLAAVPRDGERRLAVRTRPCEARWGEWGHAWCCAYATHDVTRNGVTKALCGVHMVDPAYQPTDVRGRYPRWMAVEVFSRNGQTTRRGPRPSRQTRFRRQDNTVPFRRRRRW